MHTPSMLGCAASPYPVHHTQPLTLVREASVEYAPSLSHMLRQRAAIDRQLALGLARVWDEQRYRALGYVRAVDYARDLLGIRESRARWLAKLGRALRDVPELDAAFASGRLGGSKVIELARALPDASPAKRRAWIARATTSTVRQLRAALREDDTTETDDDECESMTIPVPAHVAELCRHATEAARLIDGQQLSVLTCIEYIAADYLARVGDEDPNVTPRFEEAHREEREIEAAVARQARQPEPVAEPIEADGVAAPLPPTSTIEHVADAWQLARGLELLVEQKRRLRIDIGEQLDRVRRTRDWHGHSTFEAYCTEHLDIDTRRAQASIWFYRRLRTFRRVRRAYLRGTLSYSATTELLRVVHRATEERWITWARGLTCRDIARVVEQVAPYVGAGSEAITVLTQAIAILNRTDHAQTFASTTEPRAPEPPTSARGRPRVPGLDEAMLETPEVVVARIRLCGSSGSLAILRRALRRCRAIHGRRYDPRPDWCFLQILLVEFLHAHDNEATRAFLRAHPILARDDFWCQIPHCTSRSRLHAHHVWMRSATGPDDAWNLVTLCVGHHRLVHLGVIQIGGWAPWALSIRVGVDPRNGRAHRSYQNGRLAPDEDVQARLHHWRGWCRRRAAPLLRAYTSHRRKQRPIASYDTCVRSRR